MNTCNHKYSKSINEPRQRKCVICGEVEPYNGDMNTNEQKHTSLPWSYSTHRNPSMISIHTKGSFHSDKESACGIWFNSPGEEVEARVNAELIVRAVNSYEPMQQRIKELEETLKMFVDPDAGEVYVDFHKVLKKAERTKIERVLQSSKQL